MSDKPTIREAWEAGFKLCRSYGDNHWHWDGEQREQRWREYLEGVNPIQPLALQPSAAPALDVALVLDRLSIRIRKRDAAMGECVCISRTDSTRCEVCQWRQEEADLASLAKVAIENLSAEVARLRALQETPRQEGGWGVYLDPARQSWPGFLVVNGDAFITVVAGTPQNCDDSRRLALRIKDALQTPEQIWQPISTAPWERKILVAYGREVFPAVHRKAGDGFSARWNGPNADDFTFGGPSHWMPLPAPPQATYADASAAMAKEKL